jgi:hypothetical protein
VQQNPSLLLANVPGMERGNISKSETSSKVLYCVKSFCCEVFLGRGEHAVVVWKDQYHEK